MGRRRAAAFSERIAERSVRYVNHIHNEQAAQKPETKQPEAGIMRRFRAVELLTVKSEKGDR